MYKKFFRHILPRRFLPVLMLLMQIALLMHMLVTGSRISQIAHILMQVISIFMSISIAAGNQRSAFKVGWILLILLMPLFGITTYVLFNYQKATKRFGAQVQQSVKDTFPASLLPGIAQPTPIHQCQMQYLTNCGFPLYGSTQSQYLPLGEDAFSSMLHAMEQAEKYIFLEYFIVEEGRMWSSILDVLQRKASQGVTVRLIYDDLGCFFLLPPDYPRKLKNMGIQCAPFNPFRPALITMQNNRDHRKILSVDGKIAFTGGINLADEYINAVDKFGHWKDTAIRLEGHGAWALTVMFLQMWRISANTSENISAFYPWNTQACALPGDGLVQPYCDSPMDQENVGESVYLHIIRSAKKYLYIATPYLIVDENILSALILSAKSGVDVRIITPHRWDKRLVHITTQSYYRDLIRGGVKIYEYTPGFVHAKMFVSDDTIATVGTTNLDFRSLYLHFECGVCLYGSQSVLHVRQDMEQTMKHCQLITAAQCKNSLPVRLVQDAMRLFAPLL